MKKLLKVLIPPFIGFFIFFALIWLNPAYQTLRTDEMGEGTLRSFMAFYKYFLPLLFVIGLFTQLLVIVPVWDYLIVKPWPYKVNAIVDLGFVCLLFAAAISYTIWDMADGSHHFITLLVYMLAAQLIYWFINLLALLLIE